MLALIVADTLRATLMCELILLFDICVISLGAAPSCERAG
jgi:hypothetical protein